MQIRSIGWCTTQRHHTKGYEKARRMKVKINNNIVIRLSGVLALIAAVGTTNPVFAHSDKYNIGYSQGQTKANDDYNNYHDGHNYYRPSCPTDDAWTQANGPHSSNFCAGFIDGYNAQWTSLAPDFMKQHWARVDQQSDQSANVKINGNNNKVNINQQTNKQVGSNDLGGSSGHHSSSGFQPSCKILCSVIKIG